MRHLNPSNVCREAESIVDGARSASYGPPERNWRQIASVWTVYVLEALARRGELDGRDVAMMMVLMKSMRDITGRKRDNLVDICGYAYGAEGLAPAGPTAEVAIEDLTGLGLEDPADPEDPEDPTDPLPDAAAARDWTPATHLGTSTRR